MAKQTHTVATDALATLGTIIDETAGRDAIHLAVEPVIASEDLYPGMHIGLLPNGQASPQAVPWLGIVDPFVSGKVPAGKRFWLIVYPRQITSLRHVWEHPLIDAPKPAIATVVEEPSARSASEKWMRAWAMMHMSEDYYGDSGRVSEDAAYYNAIEAGHDQHIGPYEDARDHIDSEWWGHWEAITGETGRRDSFFSCSC